MKIENKENVFQNLNSPQLYEEIIKNEEAILTKDFALRVLTGKYTGRSPKDRDIVDEPTVTKEIDWGDINQPVSEELFDELLNKVESYLNQRKLYVKEMHAGVDPQYQLSVRIISEAAYHGLFAQNMNVEPDPHEMKTFTPDFTVLAAPNFKAPPGTDGLNSGTFIIISFEKKSVLIGGTLYSGEIKKSIFTVFGLSFPQKVNGVPSTILNPRDTWDDKDIYDRTAVRLAKMFSKNFRQFSDKLDDQILEAGLC